MQAYKNVFDSYMDTSTYYVIDLIIYKKNCETFCHTATLLIHNLKYLASVNRCFTKGKNAGRV